MFARWFTRLDQGLEAMVSRYAAAKSIRHEVPRFRSPDARMLFLAKESVKGSFFKELSNEIRRDGHADLRSPRAIVEFIWLMFSLKDWRALSDCIQEKAPRYALPSYIADLYFLSAYRLNRDRLAKGVDAIGFTESVSKAIHFISEYWPKEFDRVKLFLALLQNSNGEWKLSRDKIIQHSSGLDLIPPLAAAKSVILNGASINSNSWMLDIVPSRHKVATLVSVDISYYKKFARSFLSIHSETNPNRGVHFHCVGFDPRNLQDLVTIDESIGYTIDSVDLTDMNRRNKNGYYACARLLHLPSYLCIYDDIIISDIDGSINDDVTKIINEHHNSDVIITSRMDIDGRKIFNLPWSSINAGANIVRKTEGGIIFSKYMERYLSQIFENAKKNQSPMWFSDQCALFYAYVDLKDKIAFSSCNYKLYDQSRDWSPFSNEESKLKYFDAAIASKNISYRL